MNKALSAFPNAGEAEAFGENLSEVQGGSELPPRPDLIVDNGDLPTTARKLRDLLAASGRFFDRGLPVKVVHPGDEFAPIAIRLMPHRVVVEAHCVCRPIKLEGAEVVPVTLPTRIARMYLEMAGEWSLPPLAGITTAPMLATGCAQPRVTIPSPASGARGCRNWR